MDEVTVYILIHKKPPFFRGWIWINFAAYYFFLTLLPFGVFMKFTQTGFFEIFVATTLSYLEHLWEDLFWVSSWWFLPTHESNICSSQIGSFPPRVCGPPRNFWWKVEWKTTKKRSHIFKGIMTEVLQPKSCTSWYGKYPIIYRVLYIPGGAGFPPPTVGTTSFVRHNFQLIEFPQRGGAVYPLNFQPFQGLGLPRLGSSFSLQVWIRNLGLEVFDRPSILVYSNGSQRCILYIIVYWTLPEHWFTKDIAKVNIGFPS